jgi:hypothetical protein
MPGTGDQLQGGLIQHALRAVAEGQSANAWMAALRESGAGVRRQTGLRVYGQARALAAEYAQEPTRPLESVPSHSETRPWPTRATNAVLQTVQLFYVEKVTNNVISRFFSVKTPEGVTRGEAISRAITAYEQSPPVSEGGSKPVEARFVGAIHTGTAVLTAVGAA